MNKILLIDGHNFFWRANVVFPNQKSDVNTDTVMVYNFFRNLRALVEQFSPSKIFLVLEGHPEFRYKLFSDYKSTRRKKYASVDNKPKQDLFHQNKRIIVSLLQYLPITVVKAEKYECDDTIATLVENLKDENVVIVSNDTDFIQLLQKNYSKLKIYNPFNKSYVEKPDYHYVAWKCLDGDKSDDIPRLVSKEKALEFVRNPSLLNKFLSNEENRANFNLNKELIELRLVPEEELILQDGNSNFDFLEKEFIKMEFKSMFKNDYFTRFKDTFNDIGKK
jgi:5'-3' exonuclease